MANFPGRCTISQGDFYLTTFDGKAVTGLMGGSIWVITYHPELAIPGADSVPVTLALENPPDSAFPLFLTLGRGAQAEEIQIFLERAQHPPPQTQLWTLEHVLATKRFPPLFHAHIQSMQYPVLSAAAGVLNIPLPKIFSNVAAVTQTQILEDRKWKFDYAIQED